MAQNITLLGATYSGVPAVQLPKSGGGTALFTDVTDTTAAAEDVAQGKQFYAADGTLTRGTASGGGSASLKYGVLRPDAELVKSYTYDKYIHADEGVTMPAYNHAQSIGQFDTDSLDGSDELQLRGPDQDALDSYVQCHNESERPSRVQFCFGTV